MLVFPDTIRVSECVFTGANQSVTGGQAMTGFQQFVTSPRGRWTAKLTCQVVGEEEVLAYQAFLGALQGAGNLCLVSPRDGVRPRDATGLPLPWRRRLAFANGAAWFNGAGWAAPARADAVVAGSAPAQGATLLTLGYNTGPGLRPGNHFSVLGYLYRVLAAVPSTSGGNAQDLTIWPRLRLAPPAGAIVNLAAPVCTMRLKTDDSGALAVRWREQSMPVLEFFEAMPAPAAAAS